ncbi:MAG: heavy metal translocating P-type ATPase, partial [Myxococcota bacterium]
MLTYTFDVQGMTCGHCSARVRTALERIDGALEVHVDHDADIASVRAEDAVLLEDLLDAIEFSGYDAALRTQASAPGARERPEDAPAVDRAALGPPGSALERFGIEGMTCASCVARVERALMGVEGVARARVNYATEQAEVVLAVDAPGGAASIARAAVKAVEAAGYVAVHRPVLVTQPGESSTPLVRASERRAQDAAAWRGRWRAGAALTLPIVALQMGPEMLGLTLPAPADALVTGSAAYLTALTLWCTGRPFFEGALRAARHGATTMDTLVALGAGVAFVSSLAALVLGVDGWPMAFDAAAMIVTLIAVGKWLEARAKGRAAESLESLLHLGADRARVRREGKWIEVDVGELAVGDEVLVRAGEKIPTDAVILEGKAGVDESMITGESRAALREEGDEVVGGSIDTDGRLVVQVTRDASEGTLAEIVRLVEQAQGAKTDAQRLADRVSAVFVPAIMALSLGTFAAWALALGSVAGALTPAVAVLIVACPCALGLATPVAIMVGSGVGAQLGIVVRDAAALERARQIGAIVLDKTGTLTCGEPEVCGVYIAPGEELEDVVRLAASLESSAQHPLAEAIIRYADARGIECLDASEVRVVAGEGLEGNVDGRVVAVGRVDWVSAACEGALDDALVDAQHDALAHGD